MSLLQPTVQPPIDVLREVLASGVVGRLALGPPRPVQIYCMHGAVMAAHAPDDGTWVVRRLVNHGALTARQGEAFVRSVEQGRSPEDLLLGHVPDRLFHQVLRARFEENLLPLFQTDASCQFSPMDALFVRNIQVHHDTAVLLTTLARRAERTAALSARADTLTLRPGPSMPASRQEARLRDLCEPSRTLASLLVHSPTEPGVTLERVQTLLETGTLVSEEGLSAPAPPPPRPIRPQRTPAREYEVEDLFSLDDTPSPAPAVPPRATEPEDAAPSHRDPEPTPPPARGAGLDESWSLQGGEVVSLMPVEVLPPASSSGPAALPTETPTAPDALDQEDDPTEDVAPSVPATERLQPEPPAEPTQDDTAAAPASPPPPVGTAPHPDADPGDALSDDEAALFESSLQPAPAAAAFFAEQEDEGDALFEVGLDDAPAAAAFYEDQSEEDAPDDLSMFADQDGYRGGGQGQFTLGTELLDVVDLSASGLHKQRALAHEGDDDEPEEVLEAFGAEDTELTEEDKVVNLRFGAPRLGDEELYNKLAVCNDVLAAVARSLERSRAGSGTSAVQLLLDATPSSFAGLFAGLKVRSDGTFDLDAAAENLGRRPDAQRRTLLSRGSMDLVERALSFAAENLSDGAMEGLLTDIAGYQQRMRS